MIHVCVKKKSPQEDILRINLHIRFIMLFICFF